MGRIFKECIYPPHDTAFLGFVHHLSRYWWCFEEITSAPLLKKRLRILEIGSGSGYGAYFLAEWLQKAGYKATMVLCDKDSNVFLSEWYKYLDFMGTRYLTDYKKADGYFDVVLCLNALEYMDDWREAVAFMDMYVNRGLILLALWDGEKIGEKHLRNRIGKNDVAGCLESFMLRCRLERQGIKHRRMLPSGRFWDSLRFIKYKAFVKSYYGGIWLPFKDLENMRMLANSLGRIRARDGDVMLVSVKKGL